MSKYILPVFVICVLAVGFVKKVSVYNSFVEGAKQSVSLVLSVFPYICAVLIAVELFSASGLNSYLSRILAPLVRLLGIPEQLCELVVIRPLSGNGSLAVLEDIYGTYGPDSYIARCGSVIVGASETVFYIATVYFSATKVKKLRYAVPVSLFSCYLGAVVACLICRFI